MKTICAECNKTIKEGDDSNGVSHGLCPECMLNQMIGFLISEIKDLYNSGTGDYGSGVGDAIDILKGYKKTEERPKALIKQHKINFWTDILKYLNRGYINLHTDLESLEEEVARNKVIATCREITADLRKPRIFSRT